MKLSAVQGVGYDLKRESADDQNVGDDVTGRKKLEAARRRMWWAWVITIPIILWMLPEMIYGAAIGGELIYHTMMILLASAVIFHAGWQTLKGACKSAVNGSPNLDVLIAMGTVTSLATGFVALLHTHGMALPFHSFAGIGGMIGVSSYRPVCRNESKRTSLRGD